MREPPLLEQMAVMYATEIEALRAKLQIARTALHHIADNEYSGWGGIGGIARKALEDTRDK